MPYVLSLPELLQQISQSVHLDFSHDHDMFMFQLIYFQGLRTSVHGSAFWDYVDESFGLSLM